MQKIIQFLVWTRVRFPASPQLKNEKMKKYLFILFFITPFFIWSQTCIYDYTINKKKEDNNFVNNYEAIYTTPGGFLY